MGQTLSEYMFSVVETFFEWRLWWIMSKVKPEDVRILETYDYEGIPLSLDTLKTTMDELKTFHVRDDDIFIVTYPKAGTTWTQEITSAVLHDGNIQKLNKRHTMIRVPYLEMTVGGAVHNDLPKTHTLVQNLPKSSPRFIKSHLPGQLLPPQVWKKKIKMVYVIRNPKDVIVSLFNHLEMMTTTGESFDVVCDRFVRGTLPYGDCLEHYLYFWERRNEDDILVLLFEDMKKDLRGHVLKICEFLRKSFSDETIDAIVEHCTFENMKKNPMTNPDTLIKMLHGGKMPEGKSFMRKGQSGSWKAKLSDSQSEAIEALCKEKLAGTGLSFDS